MRRKNIIYIIQEICLNLILLFDNDRILSCYLLEDIQI